MNIRMLYGARHRVAPKGYTLIEALIVITIIVILAAVLVTSLSRGIPMARGAKCSANLRQVGTAILAYAKGNDGQLPPLDDRTASKDSLKGIWTQIVAARGYLGPALDCSSDPSLDA